jgi:hypothetical protein
MPGPALTTDMGNCMAMPDVCQVPAPPLPPIPTPFPNMAMYSQALPPTCAMTVMIMNKFAVVLNAQIPMSSGDDAGVAGGLMSGMIIGPATFKLGSFKVMAEGKGMCSVGAMTSQNGMGSGNAVGAALTPSQPKVLVLS